MLEDVSGWHTRLSESLIQKNTASGIWRNKTLADLLNDQINKNPDQLLIIDKDVCITASELSLKAKRLAAAFQNKGLVAGDVISFQLPNWNESLIIDVAASMLGLVSNPIIPIYRDAEVSYILKNAGTKLIFIPTEFRNFNYLRMIEENISEYPDLSDIIIDLLKPIQYEYCRVIEDKDYLNEVLKSGANYAQYKSMKTMSKVYKKVGLMRKIS